MQYAVTLHRKQIKHIQKLYFLMQDEDFAALSPAERAKRAGIPVEIVELYDHDDADSLHSDKEHHTVSGDIAIADMHYDSSLHDKKIFPTITDVENNVDMEKSMQNEIFRMLLDIALHNINEHKKRPTVAGNHIREEWAERKEALHMPDEEFDRLIDELYIWLRANASQLLP